MNGFFLCTPSMGEPQKNLSMGKGLRQSARPKSLGRIGVTLSVKSAQTLKGDVIVHVIKPGFTGARSRL